MTFTVESMKLPTGPVLQYVQHGTPRGIPMILLHGVTDSWRSFETVLPLLPPSIRAVAITQRGHGDSARPESGYRTRDFASDAAALAVALDLGPAIVAGHSMGSTNALRFALDYPERTRGLVLAATSATYRQNPGIVAFYESTVAGLTDPIDPAFAREFQESTLGGTIHPDFLEVVVGESLKVPAQVWRASFEGLLEDDFVSEFGRVRVPTLIVWGDRDGFGPREQQDALLSAIPGSRLVVYEGAGHALHWEQPERFAADLADFALACAAGG
jgi:non-heme chloroperoxidase